MCPTCHSAMPQASIAGQTVERCDGCLGCWFDPSELSAAILSTDSSATRTANKSWKPMGGSPIEIQCPKCNIKVASSVYAHDSGIPINKCSQCQGVWLQNGQLRRLINYQLGTPKLNSLANSIADEYAAANRRFRLLELVKSRVLSSIVVALILLLVFVSTGRLDAVVRLFGALIIPIACIWFADAMGNLTGVSLGIDRPYITEKSPSIAIAIAGWFLLATFVLIMIFRVL